MSAPSGGGEGGGKESAAGGVSSSSLAPSSLPPPRPKSPPEYPDLYGKRREAARVQMLEREIGFLEANNEKVEDPAGSGSGSAARAVHASEVAGVLVRTCLAAFPAVSAVAVALDRRV
ncbi:unnamed protein product [Arabidopsis thaliana]|uniref:Uncharacterized protein n=1 Tax=Arabidopsis thaliana TaxID=3702 RepID=A0A654G3A7_ARATH|nr:unnamed protein product [Arabidopsis thaliana]